MEYSIVPNGNNCNSNNCTGNSGGGLNSVYKGKSVSQKLMELYQEEQQRQPEDDPLCYATHLLAKLVKRDRLNCLVMNLYPANGGYSLMLKGRNGMESETIRLPYEESELLEYIDASELPPILVDILEKAQVNVFHSGCVIVEVRDYRRSSNGTYDSEYVMLKPTMQSLLCDINSLTNDGHRWTQEDVFQLESQLLLATQDPLCLDPNPSIFFAMNHQQYENKKFNDPALRQSVNLEPCIFENLLCLKDMWFQVNRPEKISVRKYSQAAVNRKRKFAKAPAPKELRLLDFISRKKLRKGPTANPKPIPDPRNYKAPNLSPPQIIDVEKYATEKPMEKKLPLDHNLSLVEEHVLEVEMTEGTKESIRIAFLQRLSDDIYFGEQSDGSNKGEKSRFQLGTREDVDKYFEQFKLLFIKNSPSAVQSLVITTNRPNASPEMTVINPSTCSSPLSTMSMPMNQETSNPGMVTRKGSSQHLSVSVGSSGNSTQQNTVSPSTPSISPGVGNTTSSSQQSTNSSQSHSGQSQKGRQHAISNSSPSPVSSNNCCSKWRKIKQSTPGLNRAQHSSSTSLSASSQQSGPPSQKTPTPTPTPPPAPTPTPPLNTIRRASTTSEAVTVQSQNPLQQGTNQMAFLTSSDSVATSAALSQAAGLTSGINITNLASLPPNLNIQNLPGTGLNIANLPALSLTGGIVPITMINNNTGLLQNQSASSLSQPALVTMVTSLPQTTSTPTTVNSNPVTTQVAMTTGMFTNSGSMLPIPIDLSQLMPPGAAQNLRPSSMPVMQLQNQQPIQLLNLSQQRGTLPALQVTQAQTTSATTQNSRNATTTGISVNSTAFSQVPIQTGKSSQLQGSSSGAASSSGGSSGSQQSTGSQLQFHQLQYKHPQSSSSSQQSSSGSSKSKSKKRATPTPPKS